MSEEKLITRARNEGICVHGLSEYYIEKPHFYKGTIILGFANLSEDEIIKGVKKLKIAWLIKYDMRVSGRVLRSFTCL